MNAYSEVLNTFLRENEPQFGCAQMGSLLGMLYCCYSQCNRLETKRIGELYTAFDSILNKLDAKEIDQVFELITSLCAEYQHKAFRDGLMIGFRLYNELLLNE